MLKQLSKNPFENKGFDLKSANIKAVNLLKNYIPDRSIILDVGQYSPMSELMDNELKSPVYNTSGDLDEQFYYYPINYDYIVYSHTIEHQFNPLYTLSVLKGIDFKLMFIFLPSRGKLLWSKEHFHEIDNYRMKLLLERAGYDIVKVIRLKHNRKWYTYLTGVRMFLRLFFEYNVCYIVKKNNL